MPVRYDPLVQIGAGLSYHYLTDDLTAHLFGITEALAIEIEGRLILCL